MFAPESEQHLFVYGSLAPGRRNAHVLEGLPGRWQAATVCGRLVQRGWGAAHGYPGVVLDETADKVIGFLFSSRRLAWHWKRLDRFEGNGYRRVTTTATLANGKTVCAQIYTLRRAAFTAGGP